MMQADLFAPAQAPFDTRDAARRAIEPRAADLRAKVLRYMSKLAEAGGHGLTADECAANLRLSILSVRPRFTELKNEGLIFDTGVRRKNASGSSAKVWNVKQMPPSG